VNDNRVYIDPLTLKPTDSIAVVLIPDIPADFVERLETIVEAFPAAIFPQFERAIEDPGDPDMHDVLKDLYRARQMV
jgi:hypothetical protein